jgi:UDP-3-O-[3-hydroxymyristoyl] N-acetylglucosamine deacetylase
MPGRRRCGPAGAIREDVEWSGHGGCSKLRFYALQLTETTALECGEKAQCVQTHRRSFRQLENHGRPGIGRGWSTAQLVRLLTLPGRRAIADLSNLEHARNSKVLYVYNTGQHARRSQPSKTLTIMYLRRHRTARHMHPLSRVSYQLTIQNAVVTDGIGLHTAVRSRARLVPAPADTGIVFRRVDLDNFEIEAHVRNVARVSYATSLMKQGVLLSTTEHLLAALYSCGIDNVFVDIDSIEIPILDGSAEPFMQMVERAGVRKLRRRRRYLKVLKPLEIVEEDRRIGVYPAEDFSVRCYVDFPHPLASRQEIEMQVSSESFRRLLSRARTFCFERQIEPLRSMGLIRGGSLENAIVLTDDGVMNGPLRFADEFGRHKALDLIGDLALVGLPLLARVEAYKAGHALHTQLVTRLLADKSLWTETTIGPVADAEQRPPLSLNLPATS